MERFIHTEKLNSNRNKTIQLNEFITAVDLLEVKDKP